MPAQPDKIILFLFKDSQKFPVKRPAPRRQFNGFLFLAAVQKPSVYSVYLPYFFIEGFSCFDSLVQNHTQPRQVGSCPAAGAAVNTGLCSLKQSCKIHGHCGCPVKSQDKAGVHLMVEAVHRFLVKIFIVILGMVMGLHEFPCAEIIDHGRNPSDGHGKIIRPSLYGAQHFHSLRIWLAGKKTGWQSGYKFLQEIRVLIHAPHSILPAMGMGRQFKVQVRNHLSRPVRPGRKHLLICAGGPVVFGIHHAPLLRSHGAEHKCLSGLIS